MALLSISLDGFEDFDFEAAQLFAGDDQGNYPLPQAGSKILMLPSRMESSCIGLSDGLHCWIAFEDVLKRRLKLVIKKEWLDGLHDVGDGEV